MSNQSCEDVRDKLGPITLVCKKGVDSEIRIFSSLGTPKKAVVCEECSRFNERNLL